MKRRNKTGSGLVRVELWKRDKENGGWTADPICHEGGSMAWAEKVAKSLLKPVTATKYTYHDELGKADYVTVYTKNYLCNGKRVWYANINIEPEVITVPSVGELGYW